MQDQADSLVWSHNISDILNLKDAFEFKRHHFPKLSWPKSVWFKDIPPSKSLFVWRLMHDKHPTYEKLIIRGCSLSSMCSLCMAQSETNFHLFFQCPYAIQIWKWFASILKLTLQFQTVEDISSLCHRKWNQQCKLAITAALINIINAIWFLRNQLRFRDKNIRWRSAISTIISNVSLSCNLSNTVASSSISDFIILKKLNISIHPPKAPKIIEVIWTPPILHWIKCNTDGSANHLTSSRGGIFRDKDSKYLLGFAENTRTGNAYHREFSGAMRAIELALNINGITYGWNAIHL